MSTAALHSALFTGHVVHTRIRPVRHRLRRRMLAIWLDLEELPVLSRRLWLFSDRRFNLFSFDPTDHLARSPDIKAQIVSTLSKAGFTIDGLKIRLLCMPRVLGMAFNPLSVFFCYDAMDRVRAILYEVKNTFGQRHVYLIAVENPQTLPIRQSCQKNFFVSPFMDMELSYRFKIMPPSEKTSVCIEVHDSDGPILFAALSARRLALTDGMLLRQWLRHGWPVVSVLFGIHFEALKLWRKGLGLRPRPAPPATLISITKEPKAA
ncbi:MAG: DUF1365 family protein [Acidocella sp.]|nr:DUF1365 family protein [Acidocella sp.]